MGISDMIKNTLLPGVGKAWLLLPFLLALVHLLWTWAGLEYFSNVAGFMMHLMMILYFPKPVKRHSGIDLLQV